MENPNQGPPNPHPGGGPAQQTTSALIRTDQVQKLPHLTDAQKATHTQAVRTLWEIMNSQPPNTPEHTNAQVRLSQLSQKLMADMRKFHLARQQQQQQQQNMQAQANQQQIHLQQQQQAAQAAAGRQPGGQAGQQGAAAGGQTQRPGSANQLHPTYQARVNAINFTLPPTISKDATESWIAEARVRYGLALQKHDMGKAKLQEIKQQYSARQAAGNLTAEELRDIETRRGPAEKLYKEGLEFLNKFKEQQATFKMQQQQQHQQGQMNQQGSTGGGGGGAQNVPTTGPAVKTEPSMIDGSRAPGQTGQTGQTAGTAAPAPHTINSAVVAARNQAGQTGQQAAVTSQAMQANSQLATQSPAQTQFPAATQQSFPQQSTTQPPQQAQPQQTQQQQQPNGSSAGPQGPPRPLSQQAAISQRAQSYSNAMSQQTAAQAGSTHAHPQGYINSRTDNNTRNVNMNIPKNLNVQAPEPVTMGASRPTLSTGPTHGAVGVMGQPAIQKHPGYVLEGEGQRVLSKKKLDILVKQVTGGGEGEGLTPDAEEFILQMADDFVDDVITAACRLAKLRPSATLDIRDLQLVLERNYNMRIPGFSSDDLRTVKKPHPTQGWTQKMSAIQAAKMTQGRGE